METKLFLLREKEPLRLGVEDVLKGVVEKLTIDMCCPDVIIDILRDYFDIDVDLSEMDTNGWQYDYWIKFTFKDEMYCLSGSGFYGDLCLQKGDEY